MTTTGTAEVDQFLTTLDHPRIDVIERLRAVVLGANPHITEHIKWNGPSFCFRNDDRVTMRVHPADKVQLIFHRGAKVKDTTNLAFADQSGLLKWVAADRATATFTTFDQVVECEAVLAEVVDRWMQSTS